jgi:hypothetical protein
VTPRHLSLSITDPVTSHARPQRCALRWPARQACGCLRLLPCRTFARQQRQSRGLRECERLGILEFFTDSPIFFCQVIHKHHGHFIRRATHAWPAARNLRASPGLPRVAFKRLHHLEAKPELLEGLNSIKLNQINLNKLNM